MFVLKMYTNLLSLFVYSAVSWYVHSSFTPCSFLCKWSSVFNLLNSKIKIILSPLPDYLVITISLTITNLSFDSFIRLPLNACSL